MRAERARRINTDSMTTFTKATFPGYLPGWVHEVICTELDKFLEQVIAKQSPRLMIFVPPRHGKTELVSRRFPAYAFGKHPDLSLIATSYGSDLASRINRDVQRVIDSPEYSGLFPKTKLNGKNVRAEVEGAWLRNSDLFEVVGYRGVYRSAGVGGGITGMGADILLIDDPTKDMEQAYSATYQQSTEDWYKGVAYTRLQPGGGVVLILTRWHETDLAGRLLGDSAGGNGDQWRVVSFPAIAEADEEYRDEGEALHPERYSLEQLHKIKQAVGSRVWASLYQQRPAALEGGIVKRDHFRFYVEAPLQHMTQFVQSWDMTFKDSGGSYVVGQVWGRFNADRYLLDQVRERMSFGDTIQAVQRLTKRWPQTQTILVEDKANGPAVIDTLQRHVVGIIAVNPHGSKEARAAAISPQVEAGNVWLPAPGTHPWVEEFLHEVTTFPNAANDDQMDAMSQALSYMPAYADVPRDFFSRGAGFGVPLAVTSAIGW